MTEPSTKLDIADFLCRLVLQGYRLVADAVNSSFASIAFETVPEEAQRKSSAFVENVASGRVPYSEVRSVLVRALDSDPFNEKAWRVWIDRFGDLDGSVGKSAATLGVNAVASHVAKLLGQKRDTLAWDTPEECRQNCPTLENYAQHLGAPFEKERRRILDRADRLDRERRTFNGREYATIDEMAQARKTHEDTLRQEQANRDDLQRRTFNGQVYEAVEDADEARAQRAAGSRASGAIGWFMLAIKRSFQYEGRSCEEEYRCYEAGVWLILILLAIIEGVVNWSFDKTIEPFIVDFVILSFLPRLPLNIRRFGDFNLPQ